MIKLISFTKQKTCTKNSSKDKTCFIFWSNGTKPEMLTIKISKHDERVGAAKKLCKAGKHTTANSILRYLTAFPSSFHYQQTGNKVSIAAIIP